MGKTISWTHQASTDLYMAFLDLLEESQSITTTTRIVTDIYNSTSILAINPEIYKLDSLKKDNNGNIRAYKKHSFRISYLIKEETIYFLRIRYTRKEPLTY